MFHSQGDREPQQAVFWDRRGDVQLWTGLAASTIRQMVVSNTAIQWVHQLLQVGMVSNSPNSTWEVWCVLETDKSDKVELESQRQKKREAEEEEEQGRLRVERVRREGLNHSRENTRRVSRGLRALRPVRYSEAVLDPDADVRSFFLNYTALLLIICLVRAGRPTK
jgi:hypothetical protein